MEHPETGSSQSLAAFLRRLERRIGAERPGRSLWVWSIPAATFLVTFVLCLVVAIVGQLGWWIGVPLALFGALYMGTTAAVNLTSGMPDAEDRDPDDDDEGGGGARRAPEPPIGPGASEPAARSGEREVVVVDPTPKVPSAV